MGTSDASLFRGIELLSSLPAERLATLARTATVRNYTKSCEILSARDQSSDVFFVLSGRIQVQNYSSEGREVIYSVIGPGEVFGEFAAIDGRPRSASIVAIEDATIARMTSADFVSVLKSDFDIALKVMQLLAAKSRALTGRLLEQVALTSRDRVRIELARLADTGVKSGTGVTIAPAPTHYQIAARVGSHREAVTKELNHLEALGYVRLNRKQIVILDLKKFHDDLLSVHSA
jgi:CRP-like cAMP-binding protein